MCDCRSCQSVWGVSKASNNKGSITLLTYFIEPKKPETIEKLRLKKKESKQKLKEKRARLVVHNLPFTSTEQNLREHFEKFGDVEDVTLLKKSDDKLVGVAFIQFKTVQQAHKAQHYTNGKEFLGRTIICESALSKNKYEEIKIKKEEEIKKEVVEIKEEPPDTYEVDTSIMEGYGHNVFCFNFV